MAMTPRLEMRQSQTLAMTPQLRQAIKLLQMTHLELADYVAGEVEKNPLLEMETPAPMAVAPVTMAQTMGAALDDDPTQRIAAKLTLWDHLHAQIGAMRLSAEARDAAAILVDELEEDGYLRVPLDEIADRNHLSVAKVAAALSVVQACDPAGIGARDLAECLALQLRERDRLDPAMAAMLAHLPLAVRGPSAELEAQCGVDADDLTDMLAELRALDPKPGLQFTTTQMSVVVPDVFVHRREGGALAVELNTETLPRILLNNQYVAELPVSNAAARAFVSECRAEGTWLLRSLEQRARTILTVASDIARHQERFFSDGSGALRPLTQKTVADRVNMHESTISRVTAGKYVACDRGVFAMRSFFSSAIQAMSGGEAFSATAVQTRIGALVASETGRRPLSDDRIVAALRSEGIDIARRTIAKYRELMGIPSSVDRRRASCAGSAGGPDAVPNRSGRHG